MPRAEYVPPKTSFPDEKRDIVFTQPFVIPISREICLMTGLPIYELMTKTFGDKVRIFDVVEFVKQRGYRPIVPSVFVYGNMFENLSEMGHLGPTKNPYSIRHSHIELLGNAPIDFLSYLYSYYLAQSKNTATTATQKNDVVLYSPPIGKCVGMGFECPKCRCVQWPETGQKIMLCSECLFMYSRAP
jgi:hypothetical protein